MVIKCMSKQKFRIKHKTLQNEKTVLVSWLITIKIYVRRIKRTENILQNPKRTDG